jgi:hypothetical protein
MASRTNPFSIRIVIFADMNDAANAGKLFMSQSIPKL